MHGDCLVTHLHPKQIVKTHIKTQYFLPPTAEIFKHKPHLVCAYADKPRARQEILLQQSSIVVFRLMLPGALWAYTIYLLGPRRQWLHGQYTPQHTGM